MKGRSPAPPRDVWISGINPVKEALLASTPGIHEMVVCRADQRTRELLERGKTKGIPVRESTRDALTALVGHPHHQGVALRAGEHSYVSLESLLERPLVEREPLVVLDCIQDPQNLGAILRSACFLGAKGVVIPRDRSARITETAIKVAAGATSYLPVVQTVNLTRSLELMKEAGLWIVGLDLEGDRSIYDADLSMPLALVVGNEQKGMRPLVRKHCDQLVKIPARGPLQSLNAATAGAVALAEVQRRRPLNPA